MMRLALSTIAVGLLTTMGEAAGVWLNELRLTVGDTGAVTAVVELVGRPVYGYSDDPTAAEKIEATVAFYGASDVAGCDAVPTAELTAKDGTWGGNYVATAECVSTVALLGGAAVAGMTVTVGGDSTVYCWGVGAGTTVTIGPDNLPCGKLVSATNLSEGVSSGSYSAVALFDKASDSDPGEGYDAYEWKVAEDSDDKAFESIGAINVCKASTNGDCNAFHDQSIAPFVYGYPKQSTEGVWLNEVQVVRTGAQFTTAIEVVGTPSATTDEEGPEKFDVKIQFYHGSTTAGSELTIEMKNTTSSDAAWKGHYSGKRESITGMDNVWTAAVGGLVMKWGEEEEKEETSRAVKEAVYCWGAEADEGKPVGSSTCQYVVKKGAFGATETASRGLYNKVGSPSAGGKNSADFYWADSSNVDGWYETIGKVNTCTGTNCARHEDQVLAEVVWVPSASAGNSLFTNGLKAQVFVVIALLVSVVRLV